MKIQYIKSFVEESHRIPLEYRNNKEKAICLLDFIKKNQIIIKNSDIYALASWVGYDIGKYCATKDVAIVQSINYNGKDNTYDLSVHNGHSYVVNGIVAHNTLNLPEDITKEEMSEIYLLAHDSGCKGITTYRDKCREGVLISGNASKKTALIYDNHAPRRPKELPCEIYHSHVLSKVSGQPEKWIFFVGLLEGRPYEVFGGKKENVEIAKKIDKGWIVKNGKNSQGFSTYDLYLGTLEDSEDRVIIKDIASQFKPEEGTVTRMTSLSLRHGAPVHIVVQQLGKDMNSQMFAIEKCIARILKRHIKDGIEASSSDTCPSCKSKLVYKDGCITCSRENDMMCSWSKCS